VAKVVALLGPRQVGKTALAREFTAVSGLSFDAGLEKIHVTGLGRVAEWFGK